MRDFPGLAVIARPFTAALLLAALAFCARHRGSSGLYVRFAFGCHCSVWYVRLKYKTLHRDFSDIEQYPNAVKSRPSVRLRPSTAREVPQRALTPERIPVVHPALNYFVRRNVLNSHRSRRSLVLQRARLSDSGNRTAILCTLVIT